MKAENIGRALGIGLRVAGRMAGEKLMGEAQTAGAQQAGAGQAGQVAAWRYKPSHLNGPYDKSFLAAVGIMVVFFYLGASSFWRARKR